MENLELLNTVSAQPYERCEAEWRKLLRMLRLSTLYVVAIQAVLRQEKWRSRRNPMGYIRTAALRCAVRMGLVEIRREEGREVLASDLSYTDWDGKPVGHDEKLDMALYEFEQKYGREGREPGAADYLPEEVMEEGLDDVAWERVAELAELDEAERLVLDLRLMGFRREDAFAACFSDEDRRYLQAGWKRFERHKGNLRKVLQSGKKHRARRAKTAGPEMELVLVETPDNRLKISFRKLVPEIVKGRT